MLAFHAKYNTQTTFVFPMVKRSVVDLAVSADWTPATGDTKIDKDGAGVANTTNNPAIVTGTGSTLWALTLTATELSCKVATVQIVDSATKAVEDQVIHIFTYGNASALIPMDYSDPIVKVSSGTGSNQISLSSGLVALAAAQQVQLNAQGKADVNAEVLDVLNTDTFAEPGQEAMPATTTLVKKIGYLYKALRNKITNDGSTVKLYNDDGTTVAQKWPISDASGTVTRDENVTGP